MQIKINGKSEMIEKKLTIAQLVFDKGLLPERIVVEHNFDIVSKDEWHRIVLDDDDNLEIISFVGGG